MTQELNNRTVKLGMALGFVGTLLLFVALYYLLPKMTMEVELVDRIKLGIICLVLPTAFFLSVIIRIGSQRFGNPSEDPTKCEANTEGMRIDLRVLSNTHEQLVIFAINSLALAVLLPYPYLSLLPIYSGVFVTGRIMFWVAYKYNVLWRAPGFAMSTLPAVLGMGYCCIIVLSSMFFNI